MRTTALLLVPTLLASTVSAGSGGLAAAPYGAGSAGTGGFVPRAWIAGDPHLGNAWFQMTLDTALGGAPALLFLSSRAAAIPGSGFTLLVDPTAPLFFVAWVGGLGGAAGIGGAGTGSALLPLPGDPNLVGLTLCGQFLVLDAAGPAGLVASDGVRATIATGPLSLSLGSGSGLVAWQPPAGTPSTSGAANGADIQLNAAGTLGFAAGTRFTVLDLRQLPPATLVTAALPAPANCMALHPDERRAYVACPSHTTPAVVFVDVDRGSPLFGQVLGTVQGLPAPPIHDMEGCSISADGRVLVVATLGVSLGGPSLLVIDVDPLSPTRDTLLRVLPVPLTGFLTDVEVSADGALGFVVLATTSHQSYVAAIDLIGGVVLRQRLHAGDFSVDVDIDPRGRWLVTANTNSNNLSVIDLTPGTNYLRPRQLPAVANARFFGVALSADGNRAVAVDNGAAGRIVQFDLATGAVVASANAGVPLTATALR